MAATKKTLVIVESPTKAKTIGKYLGSRYKVIACNGHVRDLPKSRLGVDVENDFEPGYITIRGKGKDIKEIKKEAKKASKVYLAPDPDREGEAISWHLAYILGIDPETPCRITFNEITKPAIKEAVKNPRTIDLSLVDAQQARRVLDRLVGYQISPLLWRKVRKGLSAGRVQSAALKMICDREKEIQDFIPEEYWNISVVFKGKPEFTGKLTSKNGKKIKIGNAEESKIITDYLKNGEYILSNIVEKERKKNPWAPFTTSSLQQEASNRLNFSTKKTMSVAQQLYEGIKLGKSGTTGLITYMRTDSVRVSDTAKKTALEYIEENYGKEYKGNNVFSNKKKDIQDAHEAIRPATIDLAPDDIKEYLDKDQFKLYDLIWRRFMASQMAPSRFRNKNLDIQCGEYGLKATGSELLFDGYKKVYQPASEGDKDVFLPPLTKGQKLTDKKVESEQAFTKPPSRYTEASFVRELEDKDIGRPSTYATIVTTLQSRRYVKKEKKSLVPTDLAFVVMDILEEYFKDIIDVGFTAQMENSLDDVEMNKVQWKSVIRNFYGPFEKDLEKADKAIEKVEIEDKPIGRMCPKCGKELVLKTGRFGEFIACTGYPECKYTEAIIKKTGVKCPECGKDIVEKRSRRGRIFYGCSGYPDCKNSYWNKPVDKKCPECGSLLVEANLKKYKHKCSNPECKYKEE